MMLSGDSVQKSKSLADRCAPEPPVPARGLMPEKDEMRVLRLATMRLEMYQVEERGGIAARLDCGRRTPCVLSFYF